MRNTLIVLLIGAAPFAVTSCSDVRTSHTESTTSDAVTHDSVAPPPVAPSDSPSAAAPDSVDALSLDAARKVVVNYYAAIDAGRYADAYHLWSGSGAASNKTQAQFESGFTSTAHVNADVGKPGREDAAAGSRYVEVPFTVTATMKDATTTRFGGHYVLRRAVVDGATPEQRSWRIYSAEMRALR